MSSLPSPSISPTARECAFTAKGKPGIDSGRFGNSEVTSKFDAVDCTRISSEGNSAGSVL